MRAILLSAALIATTPAFASAAWVQIPTGTSTRLNDIHTLSSLGSGAFLVAGDGGVLLRTVDEGANWTQPLPGATADLHRIKNMSSSQYYVSGTDGKVYMALNAATSFTDVSTASSARMIVYGRSSGAPRLVGSDGSSFRDENLSIGGINWVSQMTGTTESLNDATGFYGSDVHAVGDNGTILYSANGVDWVSQTSGTTEDLFDFLQVGTAYLVFGANGTILRSTDAGATWNSIDSGTNEDLYDAVNSGATVSRIMAVGARGTALYSEDTGLTWCLQDTGTTEDLRSVISQGGILRWYAVGTHGLLVHNDDNVECAAPVGVAPAPRPRDFHLASAPNPFNPRTTISFDAPRSGVLSLCIYDARGELVRTLFRREMPAGPGEITWDGTSDAGQLVASGVYFVQLRGLGLIQRSKLALLE
jgi:photosystem II stability/assembly factor-like uncharacterized protein